MDIHRKPESRSIAGHEVWTLGSGRDVVVVHGGPGFDHRYLVAPLEPLGDDCRLVFYDQVGCTPGRADCDVTAAALVDQLAGILRALAEEGEVAPAVLTHSWGSYLAYACLARDDRPKLSAAVLLSPLGLTSDRFQQWAGRQFARFSPEDQKRLQTGQPPLDLEFMRSLLKSYVADPAAAARIDLAHFDAQAMAAVQSSIPEYDFTGLCASLPRSTSLVYGECDALSPADTAEIEDACAVTVLSDSAHFPQTERQTAVLGVVRKVIT